MAEIDRLTRELLSGGMSRRRFMQRAFAFGASGALLSMGLSSCSDDDANGGGGNSDILVGFSLISFQFFRIAHDLRFFEDRAEEIGLEVVSQAADNDQTKADTQIEAMLAQGIDALVMFPVDVEASVATCARVKADAGIPIISYNNVIPSPDIDYWVARDNFQVGEIQATSALETAPSGNYVVVSGQAGSDISEEKTEGALRVLQPMIDSGDIKIVSHQFHDAWSPESALNQVEDALTKTNNDVQALISNEDGMMLGGLQALTEQDLDGSVFITGEDLFPETAQAIMEDRVSSSSWTDLISMANAAADAALALASNETPESNDSRTIDGKEVPGMRITSELVAKQNMEEFIERTEWLTPEDAGLT